MAPEHAKLKYDESKVWRGMLNGSCNYPIGTVGTKIALGMVVSTWQGLDIFLWLTRSKIENVDELPN